ncbi:hypothetical protein [Metabacillus rhizolycopersici]|uniref:Uncharacterized protein n=1 Tax=Metabacillus rhizolycopersici TaxID=2875709 RepID=A0ABS7USR3_9BACI|nr:hypothetical protein [Metabacillus rhizolycopersici]MBZ5751336.1 hypothetical protein [Metabacillus rhizolycopersici]
MKTFELKSGTKVMVDESRIVIERTSGKSAMKGLFVGCFCPSPRKGGLRSTSLKD